MTGALTVLDMMRLRPCADYPLTRVLTLWSGREGLAPEEIWALAIPAHDRIWALTRWASTIARAADADARAADADARAADADAAGIHLVSLISHAIARSA